MIVSHSTKLDFDDFKG